MLIVQRITTEWTKASRGGDGATMRNATPEAMKLPPLAGSTPGYLLQDIRYREWQHYDCHSDVVESDIQAHIRLEPLFLHVTGEAVAARFVWSWNHCGAPERDSHNLFRLSHGEWGRFTCNGRFGPGSLCGSEWSYHKTVFNVALIESFDENLFITTTPDAEESRLAVLR